MDAAGSEKGARQTGVALLMPCAAGSPHGDRATITPSRRTQVAEWGTNDGCLRPDTCLARKRHAQVCQLNSK